MHQVGGAFLRSKLRVHKRRVRRVLLRASWREDCRAQEGERDRQLQMKAHGILQGVTAAWAEFVVFTMSFIEF